MPLNLVKIVKSFKNLVEIPNDNDPNHLLRLDCFIPPRATMPFSFDKKNTIYRIFIEITPLSAHTEIDRHCCSNGGFETDFRVSFWVVRPCGPLCGPLYTR